MSNAVLYALWGAIYAICAGLGFVAEPGRGMRFLMTALSVVMFAPPLMINYCAAAKGDRRTLKLVRNLSFSWLVLTCALLVASFLTAFSSEAVGNLFHVLLTIVSSPLVACGSWALAIFCWAFVFFDALSKLDKK